MSLWGVRDSFAITGTIAVTQNSAAVVGTGTSFTTQLQEGQTIVIASVKYKILKITNNLNLTLVIPYAGTNASGLTITGTDIPKYIMQQDLANVYFVSREEAQLDTNKFKGLNEPGWWFWETHIDCDGNTRYKAEHLVAMDVINAVSGDAADDLVAADVANTITISVQPANQTTTSGAATFSVTAAATTGTLTYQWQKATATGKFSNVSGATSASLVLSGQTSANTGDRYRVVINSTPQGAPAVTSSSATLTFGT